MTYYTRGHYHLLDIILPFTLITHLCHGCRRQPMTWKPAGCYARWRLWKYHSLILIIFVLSPWCQMIGHHHHQFPWWASEIHYIYAMTLSLKAASGAPPAFAANNNNTIHLLRACWCFRCPPDSRHYAAIAAFRWCLMKIIAARQPWSADAVCPVRGASFTQLVHDDMMTMSAMMMAGWWSPGYTPMMMRGLRSSDMMMKHHEPRKKKAAWCRANESSQ